MLRTVASALTCELKYSRRDIGLHVRVGSEVLDHPPRSPVEGARVDRDSGRVVGKETLAAKIRVGAPVAQGAFIIFK